MGIPSGLDIFQDKKESKELFGLRRPPACFPHRHMFCFTTAEACSLHLSYLVQRVALGSPVIHATILFVESCKFHDHEQSSCEGGTGSNAVVS